jgi:hypothetical protein
MKFIVFCFLLLPCLVSSQKLKALDEKYGFREYQFGIDSTAIPNLKFVTQEGNVKYYSKEDDKLNIGDAKLKTILYGFYKNKLYWVEIKTEGLTNSRFLLSSLEELYGKGYKANQFMDNYDWFGKKVILMYEENSITGDASVSTWSKIIQKEKAAFEKEQAKNAKTDL